jgi:hypothetical protein
MTLLHGRSGRPFVRILGFEFSRGPMLRILQAQYDQP